MIKNLQIPVCLCVNEKWGPFAATTLASIMDHTDSYVKAYIFHSDFSEITKSKIDRLKTIFPKLSIEYIKIDLEKKLYAFKSTIDYISLDTYVRFLIPQYLPDYEKVIYTDVDVCFTRDIKLLYDENLEDKVLGAVKGIYHHNNGDNERLGISKSHDYFQAGLLLINCKKWQEQNIFSILAKIYDKKGNILKYNDQDLLNIVFENQYKRLGYRYCYMPTQIELFKAFDEESSAAINDPVIVHYVGQNKPWLVKCPYDELFWKYAKMTPFYKDIVKNKKNYEKRKIQLFKIRFLGIIPFPGLKYKTIQDGSVFLWFNIPLLKTQRHHNSVKYYLFNIIPLLSIKKKNYEDICNNANKKC